MSGTLHCVNISRISDLPENTALKIFAVRKRMFLPEGWEHSDSLAPSEGLLFKAKQKEKLGKWNEKEFLEFYKPKFLHELNHRKIAKAELKKIVIELKGGNDVAIACYCGNYKLCHRGIIGEIFENSGYEVKCN